MLCDWVRGHLFEAPVGYLNNLLRRVSFRRRLVAATVSSFVAFASPPDPTWIAGIYDKVDYDDAVLAVTSAHGVLDAASIEPFISAQSL